MSSFSKRVVENKHRKMDISRLTITHHLLMVQFSNRVVISIEEIADIYLGMSAATAKRRAKSGDLPFPVFKMGESAKSPFVVHVDDLASYINFKCKQAESLWRDFR